MKHEEIYHTCDRCGKELKQIPFWGFPIRYKKILEIRENSAEAITYAINEEIARMNNIIDNRMLEIEFVSGYRRKIKDIELCGDCRKDFEEFMKGK
jgi:tRNA G26 N,N-dimethylase Trm1